VIIVIRKYFLYNIILY